MENKVTVPVTDLTLDQIVLGRNSRIAEKTDVSNLMGTIKEIGLLHPIGVVRFKDKYRVIFGNRRYMACKKLGMPTIPCKIYENPSAVFELSANLGENTAREDVTMAEMLGYVSLLRKEGLSSSEIAMRIGLRESQIKGMEKTATRVGKKMLETLSSPTRRPKKIMSTGFIAQLARYAKSHTKEFPKVVINYMIELSKKGRFKYPDINQYFKFLKNTGLTSSKNTVDKFLDSSVEKIMKTQITMFVSTNVMKKYGTTQRFGEAVRKILQRRGLILDREK